MPDAWAAIIVIVASLFVGALTLLGLAAIWRPRGNLETRRPYVRPGPIVTLPAADRILGSVLRRDPDWDGIEWGWPPRRRPTPPRRPFDHDVDRWDR